MRSGCGTSPIRRRCLTALPGAVRWADIGSGAGFPGLVTALLLKDRPGAIVHLIESDQRKAAFLRAVSRETGAPVAIHAERIEKALPPLAGEIDAISARALAPLDRLLDMVNQPLKNGVKAVFMKGAEWQDELTAASRVYNFSIPDNSEPHPSARQVDRRRFSARGRF